MRQQYKRETVIHYIHIMLRMRSLIRVVVRTLVSIILMRWYTKQGSERKKVILNQQRVPSIHFRCNGNTFLFSNLCFERHECSDEKSEHFRYFYRFGKIKCDWHCIRNQSIRRELNVDIRGNTNHFSKSPFQTSDSI